jgi:hypothetical protein
LGADPPCPIGSSALDVRASPFMSETPCQRVSTATDRRPCPNLDQTFAAIDANEDQMVKVLTAEGRGNGLPVGPVYFSKDYVRRGFLCKDKTYHQGAVASFYMYISFSAESRVWTCAYRTVSSYLKCPLITSGHSVDAATAAITEKTEPRRTWSETRSHFTVRPCVTSSHAQTRHASSAPIRHSPAGVPDHRRRGSAFRRRSAHGRRGLPGWRTNTPR